MPASPTEDTDGSAAPHPDFSKAVLADLYRYPWKRREVAYLLWAVLGVFGGHRFYLDRPWTGMAMLVSGGGVLVWWIVDAFKLRDMVAAFNADQHHREETGLPPSALAFMPPRRGLVLPPVPDWVGKRDGRKRLLGDVLVLSVAGVAVGGMSANTGNYEAVVAIVALAAITLLGARWQALASIPVLRNFDRWSHRLRLFYYVNDPGGPIRLFFRPLYGLVSAPFRKRVRAEAWLYLQLGAWFTFIFTGMDLIQAVTIDASGIGFHPEELIQDLVITFVAIYAFAAPIGAILTTHVLLAKRDRVVWMLAVLTLCMTFLGISAG